MRVLVVAPQDFAVVAANIVSDTLAQAAGRPVCFPTGETPRGLYRELVRRHRAGSFKCSDLEAFVLDEWGDLPLHHSGRCSVQLETELFHPLQLSADAVHFLEPTSTHLLEDCLRYDQFITDRGGLALSILGIGQNGHVGFNEPGSSAADGTRKVPLADVTRAAAQKYGLNPVPTWGVTIGLKALLAADSVLLLANGSHKASIVQAVVEGDVTEAVPASLFHAHPNATFLVAEDAAVQLRAQHERVTLSEVMSRG